MFDIGFWELTVIGMVALLVIGPERLPGVARTTGLWVGRLRRVAGSFREDLERELRSEELKRSLEQERDTLLTPVKEVADDLRATVKGVVENDPPEVTQASPKSATESLKESRADE
ncbi:MAG: Sec-independent protein translocase protein TatB [Gammaproteobacteria bacterium]